MAKLLERVGMFTEDGDLPEFYCVCSGTDVPHTVGVVLRTDPEETCSDLAEVTVGCTYCGAFRSLS